LFGQIKYCEQHIREAWNIKKLCKIANTNYMVNYWLDRLDVFSRYKWLYMVPQTYS